MYGTARTPATDATFTMQPRDSTSAGNDRLAHEERAGEVDGQRPVPLVERHVGGRRERADARHVHEHVEAPGVERGLDRRRARVRVRHVALDPAGAAAVGNDPGRGRRGHGTVEVDAHQLGALGREETARGRADPAGGAGDEHGASCEASGHGGVVSHDAVRRGDPQRRGGRRLGLRLRTGPTSASSASRIARIGRDPRAGRPRDRRRGPRRHARLHRRPHPHGRAGVLGRPGANSCWHGVTTVVMGNCGFTLAPGAERRACAGGAQPRAGRGHRPACARRRHRVELGDVRRVPRRGRPAPEGDQLRGQHRPLGAAHVGRWASARSPTRPPTTTSRRWSASSPTRSRPARSGFTTSRSEHHETSDDRPVASRLATWDEWCELVHVMADAGVGMLEGGARRTCSRPTPRSARRWCERVLDLAASTGVPMTIGIIATDPGGREMLDAHRPRRRRRRAHDRPVALPRHQRAAVVPDPPAVRPAPRVAAAARAARSRSSSARCAIPTVASALVGGGDGRRLHAVARDRRDAPQARLRRHPRLRARPAAEPDRRRGRAARAA